MPQRREEGHAAPQRIPHDVGPFELQVLDECRDVARHELNAQRSIDVGRPAVPLQIDADDLPALGECREVRAEHIDRAEPAVQQDQRPARPVDLVVELDAIHVRIAHCRITSRSPSMDTSNKGRAKSTCRLRFSEMASGSVCRGSRSRCSGYTSRRRWRCSPSSTGSSTPRRSQLDMLIDQDRVPVRIYRDEAGGPGRLLVCLLRERNALGFQLAL